MPLPLPDLKIEQLNVEIAGSCNFGCVTCPQARINGGREKSFRVMMIQEEFEKVIDDAYQYRIPGQPLFISLHGSGEPTLNHRLPDMIRYAKTMGRTYVSFFTHGNRLSYKLSRKVIEAGIDEVTVSMIGYDRESYNRSMVGGDFDLVMRNINDFQYILLGGRHSDAQINTRHLILNPFRRDWEIGQYCKNIVDPLGIKAEIWFAHNWSGSYVPVVSRAEMARQRNIVRRSCGRPSANYLEVRAGGIFGHRLAVVACPIILGRDSQGVMGHLDTQTVAEVVVGFHYCNLRRCHAEKAFDGTFCEGCDYLYPDLEEVLVWSNKEGRKVGQSQTARSLVYPDTVPSCR
jgi:hypothetical protein